MRHLIFCVVIGLAACGGGGGGGSTGGAVGPTNIVASSNTEAPGTAPNADIVLPAEVSNSPSTTSTATITTSAPSHLKYFGFYLVNTGIDDPTNSVVKTNYTDDVSFFTNLNQYSVYDPAQTIGKDLDAMVAACTKPFMSISAIFWYRTYSNAPSGNRYALYADWKARWAAFKLKNQAASNPSRIGAFYMLDEPLWNGVPFADVNAVSLTLKADYPAIPILMVEA